MSEGAKSSKAPAGGPGAAAGGSLLEDVGQMCDNDSQYEDYSVEGFLRLMQ